MNAEEVEEKNQEVDNSGDNVSSNSVAQTVKLYDKYTKPKPKQYIEYELIDGSGGRATVLSSQPKKSGKWSHWVNIQNEGELKAMGVDWNDVSLWKEVEKQENVLLGDLDHMNQKVLDAKNREVQNLVDHNVYEVVKASSERF